jgi:hypothetical protein
MRQPDFKVRIARKNNFLVLLTLRREEPALPADIPAPGYGFGFTACN